VYDNMQGFLLLDIMSKGYKKGMKGIPP